MKKLFAILSVILIIGSSISFAKYYDTSYIGVKDDTLLFKDLQEMIVDKDGKPKLNNNDEELYRYNKYINEILKASQITIDIENHKLIEGFEDGTFRPNDNVTKGQFIKMAIGLAVNRNFDFSIIPSSHINHWAAPYVAVAEMQDVIDKGKYNHKDILDEPINRIEMIEILSRVQTKMKGIPQYRDSELPAYEDISTLTEEEKEYLLHACRYELLEGMLDSGVTEIRPFEYITRGEAARAIIRVY